MKGHKLLFVLSLKDVLRDTETKNEKEWRFVVGIDSRHSILYSQDTNFLVSRFNYQQNVST